MQKKIIEVGATAINKFLAGVRKIDELVGGTIGPAGRNRIIYRKYGSPLVTNDGVTIARYSYLDDEVEDLAAQTLVELALKTNDKAGDGTTSCIVEAAALIEACMKKVQAAEGLGNLVRGNVNPMQLAREIRENLPKVLELLKTQRKDITEQDLYNVIATSIENLEYGKTLSDLLQTVGKDGYISVEDNWATKYGIETETTKGMRFLGTYASPYMVTAGNKKDAIMEDTLVLVTNQHVENMLELRELIKEMETQQKGRLVIIGGFSEGAAAFSKEAVGTLARLMQKRAEGNNVVEILAIKAPSLTSDELEDVACFCDAKFIDKALSMQLSDVRLVHLGHAKKIAANEDDVTIVEGRGNTEQRIETLKQQIEREKDAMFEEKTKRRIASLASGVGIIRVGAATEQERTYLKHKIEDAVNAGKAAMEEGVVEGGGLALKKIADELGKDNILYPALMAPYTRIRENAGGDIEVGPEVLDAYKVVRIGFENACSAAGALITCDGAIAERRQSLADLLERRIVEKDEHTDFRDDENQDIARRSRRV